jgi:aarF domain-containing kinase
VQPELARLSLAPILGQLRASMAEETNLLNELQHLTTFSDFLDRRGLRGVATCPYAYRQFSSKR